MATLADFRTEVTSVLGLASSEQDLVDDWLNEGVADIVLRTRSKVIPATMALTAGVNDYTLSSSILALIDIYVTSGTTGYPLTRVSPAELFDYRRRETDATTPTRLYATAGSDLLMVYPTPSAADTISLLYVPYPTTLSSSSDTPSEIPPEWHKLVVFYALSRAADYDDDASSQMGESYLQRYERGIVEMRRQINRGGSYRLAPARLRRRIQVSSDPAVIQAF
jgi:hypothetical protein